MRSLGTVFLLGLLSCCALTNADGKKSYSGYRLIRVVPLTDRHIETLQSLNTEFFELDFWTEPSINHTCDINVPPTHVEYVNRLLRAVGLLPETIHRDLQNYCDSWMDTPCRYLDLGNATVYDSAAMGRHVTNACGLIDRNGASPARPASRASKFNDIVGTFPRHGAVETWLLSMASEFQNIAKIEDIGQTYEDRTQRMIKIGAPDSKGQEKPIIWVDAAIHAREWLTVGTTIWIINKLLTSYGTDRAVTQMVDTFDWYILPISNPDGYEYTHTSDRLWRKTRKPNPGYSSRCWGTDPNRNWDFHWRESGTSNNPCDSTYGGPHAFSENCVINMKNALNEVKSRVKIYMGVHSYSQMWLTPWAYGRTKPADYEEMLRLANVGNEALRSVHGTRFLVGTPPDILYSAAGGAYDWAKGVAGIKYAYTYELRPDGNAWNGFVVQESVIQPSGEEIWASLAAIARDVA